MGPGSIVLMHDASKNAALVLEQLLIYCIEKKLVPVNLDELLNNQLCEIINAGEGGAGNRAVYRDDEI